MQVMQPTTSKNPNSKPNPNPIKNSAAQKKRKEFEVHHPVECVWNKSGVIDKNRATKYTIPLRAAAEMNYHTLTAEAESNVLLSRWAALPMPVENEWWRPPLAAENAAPRPPSHQCPHRIKRHASIILGWRSVLACRYAWLIWYRAVN